MGSASNSADPWPASTCSGSRPENLKSPACDPTTWPIDHASSNSCGASASTRTAIAAAEFRISDADLPGEWPIVSAMHVSSATGFRRPIFFCRLDVTPALALPTDFPQPMPAKPKHCPAPSNQEPLRGRPAIARRPGSAEHRDFGGWSGGGGVGRAGQSRNARFLFRHRSGCGGRPGNSVKTPDRPASAGNRAADGASSACPRPGTRLAAKAEPYGFRRAGDGFPVQMRRSGSIFSRICSLYWGCRFAGYGDKRPSQ